MRCGPWANLFNLPSLALPTGIQLVGRRFEELDVIRAGYAVERHLPDVTVANPAQEPSPLIAVSSGRR